MHYVDFLEVNQAKPAKSLKTLFAKMIPKEYKEAIEDELVQLANALERARF